VTLYLTIHKSQGENRRPDARGKLEATQEAKYYAALRVGSLDAHAIFSSRRRGSASAVKKQVEEAFGALDWRGTPDTEGMYGMAVVEIV
jgi:hypothetical protein